MDYRCWDNTCIFSDFLSGLYQKKEFLQSIRTGKQKSGYKAYLLPELLEKPDFAEGQSVYETMLAMERSMAERIQKYEENNREYKEYIELWVHEIKLPIATGKLLVENNKGAVQRQYD